MDARVGAMLVPQELIAATVKQFAVRPGLGSCFDGTDGIGEVFLIQSAGGVRPDDSEAEVRFSPHLNIQVSAGDALRKVRAPRDTLGIYLRTETVVRSDPSKGLELDRGDRVLRSQDGGYEAVTAVAVLADSRAWNWSWVRTRRGQMVPLAENSESPLAIRMLQCLGITTS